MAATTSSIGAGANAAWRPLATGRAFNTVSSEAICPISRICDQRKLNQPLRITSARPPVANWRATASMPKVPLPGTTIAERA